MKSGSYLVSLISDPQLHLTEITIKISALAAHAPSNTPPLNGASLVSEVGNMERYFVIEELHLELRRANHFQGPFLEGGSAGLL